MMYIPTLCITYHRKTYLWCRHVYNNNDLDQLNNMVYIPIPESYPRRLNDSSFLRRIYYTVCYDFQIKSVVEETAFFNQSIIISQFLWLHLLKCIRNYRKQNKWQFKCFVFNIHGFWFNDLMTRFSNLRFTINQSYINILSCMNTCAFVRLFRVHEIVSRKHMQWLQ